MLTAGRRQPGRPRRAPAAWVDWWAANPRPDGSAPVRGPENDNVEEMLTHVAAGTAVCFGPESMAAYYAHPDLTWRRINDVDPLRIAVAWPRDGASARALRFVRTVTAARPVLQEEPPAWRGLL